MIHHDPSIVYLEVWVSTRSKETRCSMLPVAWSPVMASISLLDVIWIHSESDTWHCRKLQQHLSVAVPWWHFVVQPVSVPPWVSMFLSVLDRWWQLRYINKSLWAQTDTWHDTTTPKVGSWMGLLQCLCPHPRACCWPEQWNQHKQELWR